jgi:Sortase domain
VSRTSDRREQAVSTAAAGAGGGVAGARPPDPARRLARFGLGVAVLAALVGSAVVAVRTPPPGVAPPPAAAALPPVLFDPVPPAPQAGAAVATATTLDVPQLGISRSSLTELAVDDAGALIPPSSIAVAGWFTGSAVPGEVGPTVIAGHVDSYAGPGVFYRLDTLRPGDLVTVGRSDGAAVRYRVTDVVSVPKDAFPTRQVYGPTPGPELRLITCGGEFDHSSRRYLSNVVVSAVYADAS